MHLAVFGVNFKKSRLKKIVPQTSWPLFPGCVYKIAPPTSICMSPHILAPPVLHMQMKCHRILTFWKNYVLNDDEWGNLAISLGLLFSYTSWVGAVVIAKMSWGTELWVSGQKLDCSLGSVAACLPDSNPTPLEVHDIPIGSEELIFLSRFLLASRTSLIS